MKSKMHSMYDNQVLTLIDPLDGLSKWVFKKNTNMDGNVHTFKARLVAKGFKQTHGIDYDKTFSPIDLLKSLIILLAIVAYYDYKIWQMDVKTSFLNGNLIVDVYMTQPKGFVNPKNAGNVCKFQSSIYGLKQASRSWNLHSDEAIKVFGFIKNEDELCVYKKVSESAIVFLVFMLMISSLLEMISLSCRMSSLG